MKRKLQQLSLFEKIAYCFLGLVALWGVTYLVFAFICSFLSNKSALREADVALKSTFGIGFLASGLIILGSSVLLLVIILLVNAKKSDRDFEKAQRRAARLKKKTDVVDAPVEEVEVKAKED